MKTSTFAPESYELEIVGIFESENVRVGNSAMEMAENQMFSDIDTVKTLYGYEDNNVKYNSLNIYTKGDTEEFISKMKSLPIDWNMYSINKSDKTFLALSKSFDTLDKIINIILVGAVVVGIAVLSLVLAFWIQGRIHETGILLSVGISKWKIISQYIIELLLIGTIAFGLAYFPSKLISQNVGNSLVAQASKQTVQEVNNSFSGFNLGSDPETNLWWSYDNIIFK